MLLTMAETLGRLIKRLRTEKNISQRELSKIAGIDLSYLNQLEQDKAGGITLKMAKRIANALDVLPGVFLANDEEKEIRRPDQALADLQVSIKAYIPVYAEVSAGEGVEPVDYIAVTRSRSAPDNLRAYRVKGLCLAPHINEGDTIIVDTDRSPQPGNLIVVLMDGKASIKRFKENERGEPLLANNHGTYKPEEAQIIGVVVSFNRDTV